MPRGWTFGSDHRRRDEVAWGGGKVWKEELMSALLPRLLGDMTDWFEVDLSRPLSVIRFEDKISDKEYVLRAELPGLEPDKDVRVTSVHGVLTVKAERREEEKGLIPCRSAAVKEFRQLRRDRRILAMMGVADPAAGGVRVRGQRRRHVDSGQGGRVSGVAARGLPPGTVNRARCRGRAGPVRCVSDIDTGVLRVFLIDDVAKVTVTVINGAVALAGRSTAGRRRRSPWG